MPLFWNTYLGIVTYYRICNLQVHNYVLDLFINDQIGSQTDSESATYQ